MADFAALQGMFAGAREAEDSYSAPPSRSAMPPPSNIQMPEQGTGMAGMSKEQMSKMMPNAEHLWKFLDDLAENDPEAYKQFIEKQREDAGMAPATKQQQMVEVKPCFVVKTHDVKGQKIFMNICESPGVDPPVMQDGRLATIDDDFREMKVPYCLGEEGKGIEETDKTGNTCVAYTIVYSPKIIEFCGMAQQFKYSMSHLARHAVEGLHKSPLNAAFTFPKMKYKGKNPPKAIAIDSGAGKDPKDAEEAAKNSMFDEILKSVKVGDEKDKREEFSLELDGGKKKEGANPAPAKPLIQEISSVATKEPVAAAVTKAAEVEPSYTVNTEDVKGTQSCVVRIAMPLLASASEAELDVSAKDVSLFVEKKYKVVVPLPCTIDDSQVKAKFNKKDKTMVITAPVVGV